MSEELNFKVGDKVAILGSGRRLKFYDEVAKVTPTGRVRLKNQAHSVFNPDGVERTSGYTWSRIVLDTPELRQEFVDTEEERELCRLPNSFPWRELEVPQLRRLKALLDEFEKENKEATNDQR